MDVILNRREPSEWALFLTSPTLFLSKTIYHFTQSFVKKEELINRIRIVCISDTHNTHELMQPLPGGDILIHAGDLTQSGTFEELNNALKWLDSHPHAYKFFIAGNHDKALADPVVVARMRETYPNLSYLYDSTITVSVNSRTIIIYGSPYTPQHGSWTFQYPRIRSTEAGISSQWSQIPLQTDILITHGPPSYHLDNGDSGCPALLRALWRIRPKLHVFGHIHAARGVENIFWTKHQKSYESCCEEKGGFRNLLVLLVHIVGFFIRSRQVGHGGSTLVNAAIVGGYRDEIRRGAVVVDI